MDTLLQMDSSSPARRTPPFVVFSKFQLSLGNEIKVEVTLKIDAFTFNAIRVRVIGVFGLDGATANDLKSFKELQLLAVYA
jgi:hypothetical protein